MEKVLLSLATLMSAMLVCWVGNVNSSALTSPPKSELDDLLNNRNAEDLSETDQEVSVLKEQVVRLQQQVTEIYRSIATLDLVAKNPSVMTNLNDAATSMNQVEDPESVAKVRHRRQAAPTTDPAINTSEMNQPDQQAGPYSGPYSWPVLSGQCFLCPAGVPGPRGPPGPQGVAGRDGRDGRDANLLPPEPEAPAMTPAPPPPATDSNVSVGGAVYIRWGKPTCPSSSTLVYEGSVAGAHYTQSGSGANYLCMPNTPIYASYDGAANTYRGLLYSSEFETGVSTIAAPVYNSLHDHTPSCAVCRAPPNRVAKLMIPGRNDCPSAAWRLEYKGYLMSEYYSHHRTEFICMDENAEAVSSTAGNQNGALLYMVEARCVVGGGLPCGPYVNGRELTCAVCTI